MIKKIIKDYPGEGTIHSHRHPEITNRVNAYLCSNEKKDNCISDFWLQTQFC